MDAPTLVVAQVSAMLPGRDPGLMFLFWRAEGNDFLRAGASLQ